MSRKSDPPDLLKRRFDAFVTAEIARLGQRVPALDEACLGHVQAALERIVDDLVLSRADVLSDEHLAVLFDLAEIP